jgi:NAD-dependent dihydropyrimidine dehydrogenase PreA subunit
MTTLHPKDSQYWNEDDLQKELLRVWDICHSCRLCFNVCPSFPALFNYIDEKGEQEVKGLTRAELNHVTDLCYQCKIWISNALYTASSVECGRPRLLMRDKAVSRKEGVAEGPYS